MLAEVCRVDCHRRTITAIAARPMVQPDSAPRSAGSPPGAPVWHAGRMKLVAVLLAATLTTVACSGSDGGSTTASSAPTDTPAAADPPTTEPAATESAATDPPATDPPATDVPTTEAPVDEFAGTIELSSPLAPGCESVGHECLLPFPSDALTVEDDSSVTGRRVAFAGGTLPVNAEGTTIDVERFNRNDGFSPGSAALVLLPGIDVEGSNLPPVTDIAQSIAPESGSIIIDATTSEVWPHWAELDANSTDDARRGLFLRPAQNFTEGHRIVVALHGAVDASGAPIEPTEVFRAYRDRLETDDADVEARRPAMEQIFADLAAAGVQRDNLTIAWDFTVISIDSLTGPLLHMRDDAFDQLGATAPTFDVESVVEEETHTVIEGTYEVPLYLEDDGASGTALNLVDDADLPTVNGIFTSRFRCQVTDASSGAEPGAGLVYGHGLLGTERQATSAGPTLLAENHNYVVCGTALIGMADEDVGNAVASLIDPSNFATLVDRLLQGHLNTLFLGRLMKHSDGLVSHPAFRSDADEPLIDTEQLSYYGISQGGIMGPVSTAISFDWDRGVFGVPGVNYSTLLNRSVDFDDFQLVLDPAFPDKLNQATVLLLIQMLWDRGEGNGYVNHYRTPLPGLNQKVGLLQGALGDFQVANVALDVMARSMGASVGGAADEVRSTDVQPFWGIERIESYPFDGSATMMFDSATPLPPITNTPPRDGADPHEDVRRAAAAYDQIAAFLAVDGTVVDTCDGGPCIIARRDS